MRILYVEDDPRDADLTRRQLRKTVPHFDLELVSTQREALARLSEAEVNRYDLVLADMRLHDGDGLAILTHIRARELPLAVVMITGAGDEETAVAVLKAGANDYVVKRGDYLTRLPLIMEDALHHYRAESVRLARPLRVLYAEHNTADIDLLKRHLAARASHIHMHIVRAAVEALELLPEYGHVSDYDILLLDYRLPGLNALELLKDLYQVRKLDIPVVLVTGQGDEEVALQALKLGAYDYVPKNSGYFHQLPIVLENTFHRAQLSRDKAALRESEERFRRLAENAQDLIFRYFFLPSPGFEYVSPAATAITGYSPEEFYANPDLFFKLVHPDDQHILEAKKISDLLLKKLVTLRWIHKDEKVVWTEHHNVPICDESGNLVAVEGIIRDITERKQAEAALRESETKYRTLVDNIPQKIFTKDTDSVYLSCNENYAKDIGIRPDQLAGKTDYDFFPRELADKYRKDDKRIMATGQTEHLEEKYIQSGEEIWVHTSKTPIRQDNGNVTGILGSFWDITERKLAEAEREKLHAQLLQAQKLEAVGRLAGGVAHDFNNMLGVILGHTDLVMELLSPAHPIFTQLEEIRQAAMRSSNLTRQLLAFARKQNITPTILNLNETVESILNMLQRLIGEDINLVWRPRKALWRVNVDPSQIDQILANLCVNARDAIEGVGKITIETHNIILDESSGIDQPKFLPGKYVLLTVSDDGCGMDRETQAHLFEPFFTTKGVGEGTGLGLATVYGIVKQSNGFIHAYSEPGHGTTFKIYFPQHAVKTEQKGKESPVIVPRGGHETILLAEDETAILRMAKKMLEKFGYKILIASTPGNAIRVANEHTGQIDLLITDVVMPEMNGLELSKKIISIYPGLKCLFMSGYTDNFIERYGVLDKDINFIQKPFSMQSLAAKVRKALDSGKRMI